MAGCEVCGNQYDKTFDVVMNGESHTSDSFECAIESRAPRCDQCGVRIVGHRLEAGGSFYCCQNYADQAGVGGLKDRV